MNNNQKLFCPNCGKPVSRNDMFCQNCGYNLKDYFNRLDQETNNSNNDSNHYSQNNQSNNIQSRSQNNSNVNSSANHVRRNNQRPVHHMKHAKLKIWTIVVIVVILAGGYMFGQHYYSKSATMNRIVSGLENDNSMKSYFYTNDPSYKMNGQSLSPLSDYFNSNKEKLAHFKNQLMNNGTTDDNNFTYLQRGHHFLIFPNYQIKAKTIYPSIYTNRAQAKIQMNGQQIATSNTSDYTKKLGPILPGQYNLKASGNVNGKNLTNNGDHYLSSDSDYVDLQLKTIKFTVNTAPGSVIYINDKRQGSVDSSGNYTVPEMPYSSDMVVTAKYNGITSNPSKVTSGDNDSTINISYPGAISKDDANDLIGNLSSGMQSAAEGDDDDEDIDNDFSQYFAGGSSNTDYQSLRDWAKTISKNDNIDGVTLDDNVQSITPGNDGSSIVNFTIKYDFDNGDHDHIQAFQWQAKVKKMGDDLKIVKASSGTHAIKDYDE